MKKVKILRSTKNGDADKELENLINDFIEDQDYVINIIDIKFTQTQFYGFVALIIYSV